MSAAWESHIKAALAELKLTGDSLAETFGKASGQPFAPEDARRILQQELHLVYANLQEFDPPADVLGLLPQESAKAYTVMPLEKSADTLRVAVVDPTDLDVLQGLQTLTGLFIDPVTSDRQAIEEMISRHYRGSEGGASVAFSAEGALALNLGQPAPRKKPGTNAAAFSLRSQRLETPVIRLVNEVISEAIHCGASDIHFEPYERELKVRLRQDGVLRVFRSVNSRSKAEVVSRLKVMANLDIAEKRRPQDGRIRVEGGGRAVDIRVSSLPTDHGEKVVLRILDKSAVALDMVRLGMDKGRLGLLQRQAKRPYGMILVTGPTGSGKTTTLYSTLNFLKSPEVNITTVEDPIEYKLEGIIQTAVKSEVSYSFANALRTILRQDPNIIMVGEIRDSETAEIAIRSALTGHLVLSTLHTNDAPSAVTRLIDMRIEPFLVSSGVNLIVAQRLVRRVCDRCAEDYVPDEDTLFQLGLHKDAGRFRRGKGCLHCNHTGFRGRIGLFEMLPVTEAIRHLVLDRQDASRIRDKAVEEGMLTLREDGLNKAKSGLTTPEEVLRESA